jgi:hypothetical protein
LIISVFLLIAFFVWEARIDEIDAAMYVQSSLSSCNDVDVLPA